MCGIVGYIGKKQAVPILIKGLKSLEYRGYDSAGVAVYDQEKLQVCCSCGKIVVLEEKVGDCYQNAMIGIGHTRWATHGRPSDINSHPHTDEKQKIAVVHNGIIENYLELKNWLIKLGYTFTSETDTEVVPHLVSYYYEGDLLQAVTEATKRLRGSYALAVFCEDEPDRLIAVRKDSPLIIGIGEGETFLASDIPALIEYTKRIIVMEDGEIAVIKADGYTVYRDTKPIQKKISTVTWDIKAAQKEGYAHFMLKEIHEQPNALKQTLKSRISADGTSIDLSELNLDPDYIRGIDKIAITACGTAYHAGLVGKSIIEKILRIPVTTEIASEYRYNEPLVDDKTLVIVISQSGETADTLAAVNESKKRGAKVLAITNVVGSSVSREADYVIYTWAGPEIAVASTKAYITQLLALYLVTFYFAQVLGKASPEQMAKWIDDLYLLPQKVQETIDLHESKIKEIAPLFNKWDDAFFIGRGLDWSVALEGSLKLKEISYIHAEAYAAGELKHGTLALIVPGVPVFALCTQKAVLTKTLSNVKEIKARDAYVIGITMQGMDGVEPEVDEILYLPQIDDLLAPVLVVVPLQLFAYYASVSRGCDVDQPRNLAKSVTVE